MELEIGTIKLGKSVLENVVVKGLSYKEFLALLEGDSDLASSTAVNDAVKEVVEQAKPIQEKQEEPKNQEKKFFVPKPVTVTDLKTKKVRVYGSSAEVAKKLKVSASAVSLAIKEDRPIKKRYKVEFAATSKAVSPNVEQKIDQKTDQKTAQKAPADAKHFYLPPKPVRLTDVTTKNVVIYGSATAAAQAIGMAPCTVSYAALHGNTIKGGQYKVEYIASTKSAAKKKPASAASVQKMLTTADGPSYGDFSSEIWKIVKASKYPCKILSGAYKEVANTWGIVWDQARTDFYKECGNYGASTLMIAYWIEKNGKYGIPKGTFKNIVKNVLGKDAGQKMATKAAKAV